MGKFTDKNQKIYFKIQLSMKQKEEKFKVCLTKTLAGAFIFDFPINIQNHFGLKSNQ